VQSNVTIVVLYPSKSSQLLFVSCFVSSRKQIKPAVVCFLFCFLSKQNNNSPYFDQIPHIRLDAIAVTKRSDSIAVPLKNSSTAG
jgi:hypothetical protein